MQPENNVEKRQNLLSCYWSWMWGLELELCVNEWHINESALFSCTLLGIFWTFPSRMYLILRSGHSFSFPMICIGQLLCIRHCIRCFTYFSNIPEHIWFCRTEKRKRLRLSRWDSKQKQFLKERAASTYNIKK